LSWRRALEPLRKGAQGLAQSMQQQMGQGPGPGRTGRLGPPRAQQDTDPLGRPLRGREYGDDYTVKVPGEIDVQRARRIIEELPATYGPVARLTYEQDSGRCGTPMVYRFQLGLTPGDTRQNLSRTTDSFVPQTALI
jgi:hypothetical protein